MNCPDCGQPYSYTKGKCGGLHHAAKLVVLNTDSKVSVRNPKKNTYVYEWESTRGTGRGPNYAIIEYTTQWSDRKHTIIVSGHGLSEMTQVGSEVTLVDDGNGTTKFGRPKMVNYGGRWVEMSHSGGVCGVVRHMAKMANDLTADLPADLIECGRLRLYVLK